MRTTVAIDDDLLRAAKSRATQSGRTLGQLIEDALRVALSAPSTPREDAEPLPVFGGRGPRPGVDLSDNPRVRDLLDEEVPRDSQR